MPNDLISWQCSWMVNSEWKVCPLWLLYRPLCRLDCERLLGRNSRVEGKMLGRPSVVPPPPVAPLRLAHYWVHMYVHACMMGTKWFTQLCSLYSTCSYKCIYIECSRTTADLYWHINSAFVGWQNLQFKQLSNNLWFSGTVQIAGLTEFAQYSWSQLWQHMPPHT